jgi:HSP20 family protein
MKKNEAVPVKRNEETAVTTQRPVLPGPWGLFDDLRAEMDQFWGAPFAQGFQFPTFRFPNFGAMTKPLATETAWMPKIDIYREKDNLMVKADLPGLTKDDVEVLVDNGKLLIKGERKEEKETKEEDFYRCERSYGSFYRHIPLPEGVDLEKVHAKVTEGVLEVTVPLPAAAKSNTKKVKVA